MLYNLVPLESSSLATVGTNANNGEKENKISGQVSLSGCGSAELRGIMHDGPHKKCHVLGLLICYIGPQATFKRAEYNIERPKLFLFVLLFHD